MNTQLEEVYLEAEADIKNSNYLDAFKKYQSILLEEPDNAPTHNSMGWLYKTQIEDYKKAEIHYLAAMKGGPDYPHTYFNYVTLLTDLERYNESIKLLESCLKITSIEKSWVYLKYGVVYERTLNYEEAIKNYEKAILMSLGEERIKECQQSIERCQMKTGIAKKHSSWFGKLKL